MTTKRLMRAVRRTMTVAETSDHMIEKNGIFTAEFIFTFGQITP